MNCCNHDQEEKKNTNEVSEQEQKNQHKGHKHGLFMMLLCCIPMLLIFVLPLLNKTDGSQSSPYTFLLILICPLMHVMMMFGMRDKHHHNE
ncbi:MAG: hypothetical protein K0Q49_2255 [Haloplasmataceae bacterium]|jgi:hypothetical protein|nr:hypothetical protein [Haloplasmataceae bacterium]